MNGNHCKAENFFTLPLPGGQKSIYHIYVVFTVKYVFVIINSHVLVSSEHLTTCLRYFQHRQVTKIDFSIPDISPECPDIGVFEAFKGFSKGNCS